MDPKLKALLKKNASIEEVIANCPENEVWRFTMAIVTCAGLRASLNKQSDIEAVCEQFINDLAKVTNLPKITK